MGQKEVPLQQVVLEAQAVAQQMVVLAVLEHQDRVLVVAQVLPLLMAVVAVVLVLLGSLLELLEAVERDKYLLYLVHKFFMQEVVLEDCIPQAQRH
jgi:hypothetical protein